VEKTRAGILTISDKGSKGLRADESGDVVAGMLEDEEFDVAKRAIVPDDLNRIIETLIQWVDHENLGLIITSGGTGLSPTDVTPQAMNRVLDYQVPGMAEAMRAESLKKTPNAMLSRALAGVRKRSLIINLPGSPKAARENLNTVLPALAHTIAKIQGDPTDCAS